MIWGVFPLFFGNTHIKISSNNQCWEDDVSPFLSHLFFWLVDAVSLRHRLAERESEVVGFFTGLINAMVCLGSATSYLIVSGQVFVVIFQASDQARETCQVEHEENP